MKRTDITTRLAHNARAIRALIEGCTDAQLRWKPDAAIWSMLEVLCHLADEEELDFRSRLDVTLHHPGTAWSAIDPPSWVSERAYNEQDLVESLQRFLSQREQSIAWLLHLASPDWDAAYEHPKIGRMSARDIVTSWQAHDLLHLRQLTRLHFLWLQRQSPDARTDYAGNW